MPIAKKIMGIQTLIDDNRMQASIKGTNSQISSSVI